MDVLRNIRYLLESERDGKFCAHFPSARSTAYCGRPALWEVHEVWATTIVRGDNVKATSYDLRFYLCEKHGVH